MWQRFSFLSIFLSVWHTFIFAQNIQELGNLVLSDVPIPQSSLSEKLNQYQQIRANGFVDWVSDDNMIITTRGKNVNQLFYLSAPLAEPQQLTSYEDRVNSATIVPNSKGKAFLFAKDEGGNENFQIYLQDLDSKQVQLLTDGKSRNFVQEWNETGDKFLYLSNKRNGADIDIYKRDLITDEDKMVFQASGGGWSASDWSKDEKTVILTQRISAVESKVFFYDIASGNLNQFNTSANKISYSQVEYSEDGESIFYLSDQDGEFTTLNVYDISSKAIKSITENINWDIEGFDLSNDGKYIVFEANENGYSTLYLLETANLAYKTISNLPKGTFGSYRFSPNSKSLALVLNTPAIPSDVFVLDIESQKLTRWTEADMSGLKSENMVEPILIQYPTFDEYNGNKRMISAFLYLPETANKQFASVVSIHGGPEAQARPNFSSTIQFWVNELGVAVIVPNVRGSSGYGKSFLELDNGFLRENSVKDIGSLLDWVAMQDYLNSNKVAVYGGSYGGYMSLACMTNYNDRFTCGVDLFGISNFVTFLKNTSSYRQDLRRVEYGDEREPAMFEHQIKISPINKIQNITKPMFVFQGKNDPRVPLSESEQMVSALRERNVEVWYIMAKDEGHGLSKKFNSEIVNASIAEFLKKYLVDAE